MFVPATRSNLKAKITISGVSGSGKTMSALLIAVGMFPEAMTDPSIIAVIDTENRAENSMDKPGIPRFSVLHLTSFLPSDYITAMQQAVDAGFQFLIVDTCSHEWTALLRMKEEIDKTGKYGKNPQMSWADITPLHDKFIQEFVQCPIHVVATTRAKTVYGYVDAGRGTKYDKIGLAPKMREEWDFEFLVGLMIDWATHTATPDKDNTDIWNKKVVAAPVTAQDGKDLLAWLNLGDDPVAAVIDQINTSTDGPMLRGFFAAAWKKFTAPAQQERIKAAYDFAKAAFDESVKEAQVEKAPEPPTKPEEPAAKISTADAGTVYDPNEDVFPDEPAATESALAVPTKRPMREKAKTADKPKNEKST